MPNSNLIQPKQLDPSIVDFIRQITSGDVYGDIQTYLQTGYLGPVLYITPVAQLVSGDKSFILPLTLPYSGGSGQSVNKQYVDDRLNDINSAYLLHTTGNENAYGIKTFDFISGNILGFTGVTLVPTPNLLDANYKSAVNLDFFYNQGIIFSSGSQNQFTVSPTLVNEASDSTQAVRFSQLITSGNWLQMQIDALGIASGISGFAGVLSFNAQSGNLFAVGRGTTTVTQQGNVTFISGNMPILSGSGVYLVQGEQGLQGPSGARGISGLQGPSGLQGIQGISPTFINSGILTGSFFDSSFFIDLPYTGLNIMETFVSHSGFLSGYAIGCWQSGIGGGPLSGSIYTRDTNNNKLGVLDFSVNAGVLFKTGSMGASFDKFYRIGIDLYSGISGMQGLTIGIFGMEWGG